MHDCDKKEPDHTNAASGAAMRGAVEKGTSGEQRSRVLPMMLLVSGLPPK